MIYFILFFVMRNSITIFEDQYKFFKTFNSPELLVAFVEFMFEDKEPTWLNEQEQVIFDSLRIRMENLKKKSKAWKKSRGWWRPPKTAEEQQKNNTETSKKQSKKQQKNNTKTTEKQQEQDQVQDKVQVQEQETNISLSKDKETETKVSEYWDPEINKCLELIKSYNGWIIDWTVKNNRKYGKLLIWKLNKLDSIREWKFTRYETLDILLKIISENKFYVWKITSPELIYENLTLLMNVCKKDVKKTATSSIVLEVI